MVRIFWIWCTVQFHIRTRRRGGGCCLCHGFRGFIKGDGLGPIRVVAIKKHFVVEQEDRVDEVVDQHLPMFLLAEIQTPKFEEPHPHLFFRYSRLRQLLLRDLDLQVFLRRFQLLHPLFRGRSQDSLLHGVQKIADRRLRLPELLLVQRQVDVLPVLDVHHRVDDRLDPRVVVEYGHGLGNDQVLDPVLADSPQLAGARLLFRGRTLVIVMDATRFAGAALAAEVGAAVSAEQLRGEEIIVFGLVTGRSFPIFLHLLLHPVEQILRNDGRDTARRDRIPKTVLTDITPVLQKELNAVEGHLVSAGVSYAMFVEIIADLLHGRAVIISFICFQNVRRCHRVDLEMLLTVDGVSQGKCAAVVFALESVIRHPADDLLREVSRIVFGVSFQNGFEDDALRTVGNDLGSRHDLHAVLTELSFVSGAVISIPGEAIQLPYDDHIEQLLAAVLDHVLKLRSVIRLGGVGPVDVVAQDRDAVFLGKSRTLAELTFDGFLALAVGRIACVDDCRQFDFPPFIEHSDVCLSDAIITL